MKLNCNFILLSFFFLSVSCNNITAEHPNISKDLSMEKQISRTLEAKYDEEFTVLEHSFDKALNIYTFKAHPSANDQVIFEGDFDEREKEVKNKIDSDGYVNSKYSWEAGDFYESLFPNKELKLKVATSVYSYYQHEFGSKVPDWDDYLENRDERSTIRMNCYFFDIPDGPYHQLVITMEAIIELLHEKYGNNYSIYTGFWPSGFLEDFDFEKMTVGFESTSMEDADNLLNKMQYLSKEFFVKIVNRSIEKLTDERIYSLIKDHNKNGPTEMVEI